MQLDSTVVQALSRLLDVKPEYDWTPLNWYVNPDLPDMVINKQPSSVIADLMGVMDHIITEGEEEAYKSEIQYRNAQSEFKRFLKSAEGWRKFEFISSILGMIALMALIIIAVFRSRIVESIILGSVVMDEYKFVNPSAPPECVKARSLPPVYPDQIQFQPPTLPHDWGDKGAEGKQKLAAQMTAWVTTIFIIITLLAILYTIFKKCRYVSSLPRVCFPLYPFSTILRGHRAHGYFRRGCKPGFSRSHVGAFRICHSPPLAIKDHRLPPCLRHAYYKTLLLPTAPGRLAEYNSVRFGSKHN